MKDVKVECLERRLLSFINQRWKKDSDWLNGNCYWFALILKKRFPEVNIVYLPIEGHFVVEYEGNYFDWRGHIQISEKPIFFEKLHDQDPLWYNRIIRDCFD